MVSCFFVLSFVFLFRNKLNISIIPSYIVSISPSILQTICKTSLNIIWKSKSSKSLTRFLTYSLKNKK